ncbi:MAG: thioesterase family protein [Georgfuchsia sp.]
MARIFIDLPESFPFSTEIPLYYQHINMGGHLDNAMMLSLVGEARMRLYRSLGYEPGNIEGLSTFVGDMAAQYLSQAFYGEVMVVEMTACDFTKHGCDMVFRISDKASGREVVRGKTGMVFYDKQAKKVALVPESFKNKFPD